MKPISICLALCALLWLPGACQGQGKSAKPSLCIQPAAYNLSAYLPILSGKRVGVVANQTSCIGRSHLVDTLLSLGVDVVKVFAPEHGFRGDHADGAEVQSQVDKRSGISIVSLYGAARKPDSASLRQVDIIVFDIQDVGVRFYTFISTLTYMMEGCAKAQIPMMLLDRPNPNGFYVDGPVLEPNLRSFVGMHPVPVVYGLTIGEYALMVKGENWIEQAGELNLKVVPCANYTHDSLYRLPVKPSPNLATMEAVYFYPSLGFFEGTPVSIGRGTTHPFEMFGHPTFKNQSFVFEPKPIPGVSDNPPQKYQTCYGRMLNGQDAKNLIHAKQLNLAWLIEAYALFDKGKPFFTDYFEKLCGTGKLRGQITGGMSETDIRKSWSEGIEKYLKIRSKYLLYPDFTH